MNYFTVLNCIVSHNLQYKIQTLNIFLKFKVFTLGEVNINQITDSGPSIDDERLKSDNKIKSCSYSPMCHARFKLLNFK